MNITIPYYEDNTRISNSALGWFINNGPAYFHARMSGQIEDETTSAMSRGTMIHMYLLQPEEFQKTYKVWTANKPKSAKQTTFCEALATTIEIEPNKALIQAYREAYSTTGQSDEQVLPKAQEMANMLSEWIEYTRDKSYEYISVTDAKKLDAIKTNCKEHKLASKLLNPIGGELHHEFHINWEWDDIPCKSLLDSVHFDFENKICTLVDLKTTVKIGHFEDSIEQYDYFRQLEFYRMALEWYLRNERNEDPETWTFRSYIIAIDTVNSHEIRVFKIPENTLLERELIMETFYEIDWHIKNNKWDHHREYYEGDGAETLKL